MNKLTLSVLGVAFLLTGCASTTTTNTQTDSTLEALSGAIQIDGSSTVYPLSEAVAEEFRTVAPDVNVTVGLAGTGGGFQKLCRGEIDINDASRAIKDEEITACDEEGITYTSVTVAYDGMAVLVNPENTWVDELTVEELKMMWEPEAQGVVTKWNQIRPEWPDEEFHLYGPGTASGTFDYFTEEIVGEAGKSRGDYTASEDDNVLVQGIANDENALGFFGLAYYSENADKMRLVPIDNGSGAILPSEETVKDGTYAPLSRPLYIYVTSTALERLEVAEFVKYYIQNVGELTSSVGYISLSDEEYQVEIDKFEQVAQ